MRTVIGFAREVVDADRHGREHRSTGSPAGIVGDGGLPAFVVIGPAITIDRVLVAEDLPPTTVAGPMGAFSLRSPFHIPPPPDTLHLLSTPCPQMDR